MQDGTALLIDFGSIYLGIRGTDPSAARQFARNPVGYITDKTNIPDASDRRVYMGEGFRHMADMSARAGLACAIGSTTAKGFNNGTDHRLVVDAISLATSTNSPRRVVIVSGDADFVPLIHALNRRGIATTVVAGDNTSAALRNAAGRFIDLAATHTDDSAETGPLAEVTDISTRRSIPEAGRPA